MVSQEKQDPRRRQTKKFCDFSVERTVENWEQAVERLLFEATVNRWVKQWALSNNDQHQKMCQPYFYPAKYTNHNSIVQSSLRSAESRSDVALMSRTGGCDVGQGFYIQQLFSEIEVNRGHYLARFQKTIVLIYTNEVTSKVHKKITKTFNILSIYCCSTDAWGNLRAKANSTIQDNTATSLQGETHVRTATELITNRSIRDNATPLPDCRQNRGRRA